MQNGIGYRQIYTELCERINSGNLAAGSLLPPERRLCEEFGVERTTLRRALALLADDGLIIKKPGYGSFIADRSKAAPLISFIASSPTLQSSGGLGMHHFLTPVYNALAELCAKDGFRSISMMIAGAGRMESLEAALKSSRGVILADNVPEEFLRRTRELGIPCVLMSERAHGFRSVLCDNDDGLMQAVEHLASLGHKHIAYVGGDRYFLNSQARIDGFRRAMFACGLDEPRPAVELCGWGVSDGIEAMRRVFEAHPETTAVCAANDHVALGVCRAAKERGLRIPVDFSVIGFGDMMDEQTAEVELTTVRIPPIRFARELYRSLLWELEHPYEDPAAALVEAELIVRSTTAKINNSETIV